MLIVQIQYKQKDQNLIIRMTQQASLEAKQMYLRDNIDQDEYQNFYEYCQQVVGSVDINSWNMAQVQEIVRKFNAKLKQEAEKNAKSSRMEAYNQYQSRQKVHNPQKVDDQQQSQISECKSSKIAKSSALSLLDQIMESPSHTSVKAQQKSANVNRSSMYNMQTHFQTDNNQLKNNSSFSQFQFWVSTTNANKNEGEVRNKSVTQSSKNAINMNTMGGSPPTTKNTYNNFSEYYNVSTPSNNLSNVKKQQKQPNQSVQFSNSDFDFFTTGIMPQSEAAKKSSPYLKKQPVQQAYEGSKTIKLKQIKQFNEPSMTQRGSSVNRASNMVNYQQPFQQTITCFKCPIRTQLTDRSLSVFIDKHQIIERKFLAADYAMYNVKVVPLGIQCKRNYEDFAKLKQNLAKFFPGVHLPYLQQTSWLSGTNIDFITNQKKMLELFVRDLIRNNQLRHSRVMEDFLTLKDHKSIKRKFQKYEAMPNLKGLQQLSLLQGKVKVTLNSEQKIYIQNFQKFVQKMGGLYDRQQKLTQTLIDQYEQVMKTFKSLIGLMQQMEKQIRQFNSRVPVNIIRHLGHSMKIVRQTYKQELSNIKFDFDINSKKILPFLKYQKRNLNQLNKLIDIEKKMKRSFDKRSLTEKIGTGESYMSESTRDGAKKGILQQSPSLIVLKHQVGYLGYQVRTEGQRVFDQLAVKTLIRWQTLGNSYMKKIATSTDYWNSLINFDSNKFNTDLTF